LRILLVFPFLPYPPDDGGKIGFFNPIKYVSRKHEVSVVCLTEGSDQESSIQEFKKFCSELRTFKRPAWRDQYCLLKGMVLHPPGSAAKYWYPAAGELIKETIAAHKPHIVEFHHLNTAIYRSFAGALPTVLREHNVEFKVWERHGENASSWVERSYARLTAPRVRRYEAEIATHFNRCVVVSDADAAHLRGISPEAQVEVIPSGVDTEYFYPSPDVEEEPLSITFTGSFEWKPKQHSLHALLTQVFPRLKARVPEAKLYVVGKGIPEWLRRIAHEIPGVRIEGAVPDVRPYIAKSALLINYLEGGGGIALKVLEAMAMRKPVLSNSLGCEGIPMRHGRDVFVADGPDEFAAAACCLLGDRALRSGLAEEGYRRVLESYSWNVIADRFQDCYQRLIEERRGFDRIPDAVRAHSAG
jgi:glycosyltransferase involved in cell wall biosynthesis